MPQVIPVGSTWEEFEANLEWLRRILSNLTKKNAAPWASTTIKIMVDPMTGWLKPLGFNNGGYIIPPIVLMVVGIPQSWKTKLRKKQMTWHIGTSVIADHSRTANRSVELIVEFDECGPHQQV